MDMVRAALWHIWLEHNNLVFNNKIQFDLFLIMLSVMLLLGASSQVPLSHMVLLNC